MRWFQPTEGQRRRLADEIDEVGLDLGPHRDLVLEELACARHPIVHERRIISYGAFVAPATDPATWNEATTLQFEQRPLTPQLVDSARRFADGMSSWLLRGSGDPAAADPEDRFVILDRPASSERDLVVIAETLGGVVVQRHPNGFVRVVSAAGVHRWNGYRWHTEPLVTTWMEAMHCTTSVTHGLVEILLEFAVHDLGARNIGAILVFGADPDLPGVQPRLAAPPYLNVTQPSHLAPLRHVLNQVDGAALFDTTGRLIEMGARLIPSTEAEARVRGFGGMRHTSALRYSYDDPSAVVIVVSEDGPVTVFRGGHPLGGSPAEEDDSPD